MKKSNDENKKLLKILQPIGFLIIFSMIVLGKFLSIDFITIIGIIFGLMCVVFIIIYRHNTPAVLISLVAFIMLLFIVARGILVLENINTDKLTAFVPAILIMFFVSLYIIAAKYSSGYYNDKKSVETLKKCAFITVPFLIILQIYFIYFTFLK